jgi:PilZ domain
VNPIQKPGAVPPAGPQQVKRSSNTVRAQTAEERRRAQRVLLRMPVIIHIPGKANPLHGFTNTVSANGAMIVLPEGLAMGTKFTLENPKAQKKVDVHVVRAAQANSEGSLIPVEFLTPSPNFWNIFFPPTATN